MFDGIAPRYDLANHLLSGGVDFYWRWRATGTVERWGARRILDLATGSGDLALAIQRRMPQAEVTGADFSTEMLARARAKGLTRTTAADALALPFEDGSFDCVTVAFGLRNMSDWAAAIREMARVVREGGHLLVLDFSVPVPLLRPAYRVYLHRCLPALASLVTGRRDAYEYLAASIEEFPSGGTMTRLIDANGFASARATPFTGGIATMYTAEKSKAFV
ncbi:MAG: Demethylmenaquinone methyltransferase [uncultured Chthoniobacterales bacterium]|uniref:Demethylmenaquinone methyltransferase n=1 Tax=uncultured Chthoniobacterales bacterium TaxID=1836801 RepID=A0A6J4IFY1_9BACT|nr:MAG: Demethylmenaquinone methyltransferase [uncultured Chthoniobacterales bacterium]